MGNNERRQIAQKWQADITAQAHADRLLDRQKWEETETGTQHNTHTHACIHTYTHMHACIHTNIQTMSYKHACSDIVQSKIYQKAATQHARADMMP